ncbi:MAG: dipeptidase PepE [Ichthyobacteriaceae bacterium]|nr:dipeptidase PepE [Ichthyobacteriaceae bacterium]
MKKALIISTSTIHGSGYLEYILPEVKVFFENKKEIIFIPYARPGGISLDEYTKLAKEKFSQIGLNIKGLHEFEDKIDAIKNTDGIFTGGGNTFLLVKTLHDLKLMQEIKNAIELGVLYMGTSAGSNLTGINMSTTNDMPIVYPLSFDTLGIVPFNLNPHYLDPIPNSTHKGETRETRIQEFHTQNNIPVVGLREGSWLEVNNATIILKGGLSARIFEQNKTPYELKSNSIINFDN